MRALLAIAAKDLRLLARNRGHLFFTFAWPLVSALFFGMLFGGGGDGGAIQVRTVDEDATPASGRLLASIQKLDGVNAEAAPRDVALDAVRRGKVVAAIIVPKGYGEAAERLFHGEPPALELHVDPARGPEAAMLEGQLTGAAMEQMAGLFTRGDRAAAAAEQALAAARADPEARNDANLLRFLGEVKAFVSVPSAPASTATAGDGPAWKPVSITRREVKDERLRPQSGYEVAFPQGVLWGMLGCALGFALSLVTERTRGTMARLQTSPLSRGHLLAGKALACFVALLAVQALLLGLGRFAFGVIPGSVPLLVAACVSLATAFVGLMMVVAVLAPNEQAAGGLAWAVFLPLSMIGGGMVPLFVLPAWMQTVSHVSPVKWGILALEGAIWRGFGPAEMLLSCGVLLGIGLVGFAAGVRLFSRRV